MDYSVDTNASAVIGKNETLIIAVRLLSYDAAVFFQDKCGRYYCILTYNFVLYITCSYVLENDYIFKSFVASKWNISNTTSKCTVDFYE